MVNKSYMKKESSKDTDIIVIYYDFNNKILPNHTEVYVKAGNIYMRYAYFEDRIHIISYNKTTERYHTRIIGWE